MSEVEKDRVLEAIGKACSMAGHDLNNLLGAILGSADLVNVKMNKLHPEDNPVERQLGIISRSVKKATKITEMMRSYARPGELELSQVDPKELVEAVIAEVEGELSPDVELSFIGEAAPSAVEIAEYPIRWALKEIIINAAEACFESDKKLVTILIEQEQHPKLGEVLVLSVLDSGEGIEPERLSEVMSPFSSDKPRSVGKGFGLTLGMARLLMKKHAGYLSLDSEKGVGTTVKLVFPLKGEKGDA